MSYSDTYEKKQLKTLKEDTEPQKRLQRQSIPSSPERLQKQDLSFSILARPKRKMKSFSRGSLLQLSARKLVHNTFL